MIVETNLPAELAALAQSHADGMGMDLGEYIAHALATHVTTLDGEASEDPAFIIRAAHVLTFDDEADALAFAQRALHASEGECRLAPYFDGADWRLQ